MALKDKLRKRWLQTRGFYSPDAPEFIPNTPAAREENRQTNKSAPRKPYRPGDKSRRVLLARS